MKLKAKCDLHGLNSNINKENIYDVVDVYTLTDILTGGMGGIACGKNVMLLENVNGNTKKVAVYVELLPFFKEVED